MGLIDLWHSPSLDGMWPKQVIARIEGGLGNQLFQYAAARSLADRLSVELLLDLRALDENGSWPYQLDLYRIRAQIAEDDLLRDLPSPRSSRWGRIRSELSQRFPALVTHPVFWPRSFAYDPRVDRIRHPVYMVGYWQTERYFAWNRENLLQDIQLCEPEQGVSATLEAIRQTHSVALHIRRGDYVSNTSAAQFHGLCDLSYYQRAVQALQAAHRDIEVFVFSDEPDWAQANLRIGVPMYVVRDNPPGRGHVDMELMRQCRHHILANSSFSWWGAWRCATPGQMVYAPSRWFADAGVDTSDVIPSRWTCI